MCQTHARAKLSTYHMTFHDAATFNFSSPTSQTIR
jgi:hypothetical protein